MYLSLPNYSVIGVGRFKYRDVIEINMESTTEILIKEIYRKIEKIEREVDEIKGLLIGEESLTREEEEELEEALKDIENGDLIGEEKLREILREGDE